MTKHIRGIAPSGIENVSRRSLLKGMVSTGGLVLALTVLPQRAARADAPKWGADGMPHGTVNNPLAFVSIAPDGTVTIVCHRSDMGQGVRTGMPLIVADELEADWARVKIAQATGDEVKYGNQDTDGSRSTRHFIKPMRQVGAAARMMLEEAAAKRWGVAVSDVEAKNHEVVQKSTGKTLGYGELAEDASEFDVPATDSLRLKDPSQFRYIGKEGTNIVDAFNITTGRATYGQDIRLPGQKYAVVARPPVMGGKVASYDATETKKVPGFVQIVEMPAPSYPMAFQPSGGIAVIADNTWAAIQGRNALKIVWDDGPHATYDSQAYRAAMEATARQPGMVLRSEGDFAAAFAGAAKKVEAEYYIPHNAHATMEPPSATCRIADGKAEVWTSVQSPQAAHDLVAKYLGLPGENVTVNVTLLGGGFGRKSKPDFAVEAALCSKAIGGAPVKVVWTREDDIRNDFYHTVSVERIQAGLDKDGKVVAWRHNSVAPSIGSLFVAPDPRHEPIGNWVRALSDLPFDIENISLENGEAEAHTKIGWWRSVSNVPHGFAIQSFVAELASGGRQGPEGVPARPDRPCPHRRRPEQGEELLGLWREPGGLSDRHRAASQCRGAGHRKGRLGTRSAERPRPWPCRPSQLRELCRGGHRSGGRRQGQHHHSARRHSHRLRTDRQSRSRPLTARRRGDHGARRRSDERNLVQGRQGPATQPRRLSGVAHQRRAA